MSAYINMVSKFTNTALYFLLGLLICYPKISLAYNDIFLDKIKTLQIQKIIDNVKKNDWKGASIAAGKDPDMRRFVDIMKCSLNSKKDEKNKCAINITHESLNNQFSGGGTSKTSNYIKSLPEITNFDELLWKGKTKKVKAYILKHGSKVSEEIKLRTRLRDGTASRKDLAIALRMINNNFSVRVDYITWCVKNNKLDTGVTLLLNTPDKLITRPAAFWELKRLYIREIIYHRIKHLYKNAYKLASSYYDSGINFNEAEWLCGWISLILINNPQIALKHFTTLFERVKTPISISKASYWLARTYEKLNDVRLSNKMYEEASNYYNTFYGQISILKINNNNRANKKNKKPLNTEKNIKSFFDIENDGSLGIINDYFKRMFYLTGLMGENGISYIFLDYITKNAKDERELLQIYNIINKINDPYILIMYGKLLEKKGMIIDKLLYPRHYSNILQENYLIYSIIRQESRFSKHAKSNAGALGIMQVMPSSARHISKKISINHHDDFLLLDDLRYNIMMGTNILKEALDYYNNSLVLSIAAYNAGIANVDKWVKELGDIRKLSTIEERINWIESIPFYETRDYVVRVLENLSNYRRIHDKDYTLKHMTNDITS